MSTRRFACMLLPLSLVGTATADTGGSAPVADPTPIPADLPAESVEVFRSAGALQCEEDSGMSREAMAAELTAAGVAILDSRTSDDGVMRIAVCGAPAGLIHVFRIPPAGLAAALSLGFRPLAEEAP